MTRSGKTAFLVLAALLLSIVPLAGSHQTVAQDEGPIIIGAPVNLTDWMSAYDVPPLEGAKLAVKSINEQGGVLGRELQIIELDGQTDPATVGNVARELIDQGAEVILAPCDFDFGAPASQAAQEAGLVGISFCASSPLFGSEALGDKQFTLSMWNQTMSAAAAQFGIQEQGWTTAATIIDQGTEYTQSLGDYIVETWAHLGGEVVSEDTYQLGDMTASAQAQRILDLDEEPDVIFISANMPDYAAIIADVRSAGIESAIMGGDAMDTAEFYEALGSSLGNNIFISTHSFIGPETGPEMEEFIAAFEEEYGRAPGVTFAAMGWDVIHVLAQAIEAAGTTEGAALAEAMVNVEYSLLSGNLTWSDAESGHIPNKEAFILEVVDGQPTFVMRLKPEWQPEA
ncbi:MAG: ABC transporter substrate-binding protein [Thermomicrobiales bacterium]